MGPRPNYNSVTKERGTGVTKERDRLLELRKRVGEWDLKRAVEVARALNRRLSLALTLTNAGSVAMVRGAIRRMVGAAEGREWKGITFYQCPDTGFVVMRLPPAVFTEDFGELLEMAWEAKIVNQGLTTPDAFYKLQHIQNLNRRQREATRRAAIPYHECGCGCGTRIYTRARWVSGHDGRVKGWFMKGSIPPHLERDYHYWRATGCLLKLGDAILPSGNM